MITDRYLTALEKSLDLLRDVEIVPLDENYPTAGHLFTTLTGETTATKRVENTIHFIITFTVKTFIRERDVPIQEKDKPYLKLLHLQESITYYLMYFPYPHQFLRAAFPGLSFTGFFNSTMMDTKPETVGPLYYGSRDEPTPREQGIYLTQRFTGPTLIAPAPCGGNSAPWADIGNVRVPTSFE